MNTEKNNISVSKALQEVWDWKQQAWNNLQSLPKEKRMLFIKENTQAAIDAILLQKKKNLLNQ